MQKTPLSPRPRRSPKAWEKLVKDFEASGQSRLEFCEQHNVGLDSFRIWFRKLRSQSAPKRAQNAFVAVKVTPDATPRAATDISTSVEVRLKNNRSLIVHHVCLKTQLADLIQIAESVTPC